jgi:rhamnulokinase
MRHAIDAQLAGRGAKPPRDIAGYVRLICASLAAGHADAAGALRRLSGKSFQRILMVGGGSQNRLLCQATADASGLPVASYALEGAAVGNVAAQLVALGEVRDNAAFRRIYSRQLKAAEYYPRPASPRP